MTGQFTSGIYTPVTWFWLWECIMTGWTQPISLSIDSSSYLPLGMALFTLVTRDTVSVSLHGRAWYALFPSNGEHIFTCLYNQTILVHNSKTGEKNPKIFHRWCCCTFLHTLKLYNILWLHHYMAWETKDLLHWNCHFWYGYVVVF